MAANRARLKRIIVPLYLAHLTGEPVLRLQTHSHDHRHRNADDHEIERQAEPPAIAEGVAAQTHDERVRLMAEPRERRYGRRSRLSGSPGPPMS